MAVKLAIAGAAGRMGQRLVALAAGDPGLDLAAALDRPDHPRLRHDAGEVAGVGRLDIRITAELTAEADVVIDFSVPEALAGIVELCQSRGMGLVLATTGLSQQQQMLVRSAADKIPVVWAPNMSLAVNLAMKLTEIAAGALRAHPSGADVEVIERHHRFKEDAPSGTALRFGEIIAAQMGQTEHVHGREGRPGPRPPGEIGYHALRVGDNPGEHTIVFGLLGETIELHVSATSRDCYAQGALAAARFVAGRSAGMYTMQDVLGL